MARQFKLDEAIKDVATVCGVRYEDVKSAINMTQAFAGGKKKRIWHKKDGYALDAER